MQFWLLTLITQLRKIISERWRPSCRTHVRSLSSKFCITFTNIFLWHSCNFFANGNFQIVDCTRFSNVDFWSEVTQKKETLPTTTHFKNMRTFCATLCIIYYIFLSYVIYFPILSNLTNYVVHYHYILRCIAFSLCNIIIEITLYTSSTAVMEE